MYSATRGRNPEINNENWMGKGIKAKVLEGHGLLGNKNGPTSVFSLRGNSLPRNATNSAMRRANDTRSRKSMKSTSSVRSFDTLYSRQILNEHKPNFELGYTEDEIIEAVNYIFKKYDKNRDNFLDTNEVHTLILHSLKHMNTAHSPQFLEVKEFIMQVDKNNDGKLSKHQLVKAFKRSSHLYD